MPTAHVFIATSLDGYIARPDGDIDWLLQRDDPTEDHGYSTFIADKNVIVMGRGTYEKVATFDTWFYELPVVVLSEPDVSWQRLSIPKAPPTRLRAAIAVQLRGRLWAKAAQPRSLVVEPGQPLFGDARSGAQLVNLWL